MLVTYRDRPQHLACQLAWWQQAADVAGCELLLLEVSAAPSPGLGDRLAALSRSRYLHISCPGVFHKTRALNSGLALARGSWVAPFDVDLLPVRQTLRQHLAIARRAPELLVSGYRLLSASASLTLAALPEAIARAEIAPEDRPSALWKQLTRGERFGVVPLFQRDRLQAIGGWDEGFIGWGGEDQEVIERYLADGRHLCRVPDLLYLHLAHAGDRHWSEPELVAQNRAHYYAQRDAIRATRSSGPARDSATSSLNPGCTEEPEREKPFSWDEKG